MSDDTEDLSRVTKRFEDGSLTQYQGMPDINIEPGYACVTMEVMNTDLAGTVLVLPVGTFTLGRALEADHLIAHPTVSRKHCTVVIDRDRIHVRDENSAHGLLVNGQPAREAFLKERDVIQLGDVALLVDICFLKHLSRKQRVRYAGDHRNAPAKT